MSAILRSLASVFIAHNVDRFLVKNFVIILILWYPIWSEISEKRCYGHHSRLWHQLLRRTVAGKFKNCEEKFFRHELQKTHNMVKPYHLLLRQQLQPLFCFYCYFCALFCLIRLVYFLLFVCAFCFSLTRLCLEGFLLCLLKGAGSVTQESWFP